jgi:hypothetical protein
VLGARELSPYRVCGLIGLLAATGVALSMAADRRLSIAVELVLIAVAVAVFLGLALAETALVGRETIVYYHHEIAVLLSVALVAAVLGRPVLAHLDVTATGLGAFLACGRVGCMFAGCCHGRPGRRGVAFVAYGESHGADGFPAYLVDTPLRPVQAYEALCATALVACCALVVPSTPGAAFGAYVTGYALIRFLIEVLRGDPVRRYWRGLSEAQWTSLGVVGLLVVLAASGALPGLAEHAAALALLAVAAVVVACRGERSVLAPRHVRELAALLPAAGPGPGRPRVVETSLGIRLSAGSADGVRFYTVTRREGLLDPREALDLASVLQWLAGAPGAARVVAGAAAHHVMITGRT